MRIVGGQWRGRPIESPRGREVSRPTTDRVREAIASMLESALAEGIEGARVLDAFAGSGALGLEMLSRGAGHATFFDADRGASALVKRNLSKVGCAPERFAVACADVLLAARRGRVPGGPFDAVLIDPPLRLGDAPRDRARREPDGAPAARARRNHPVRAHRRHARPSFSRGLRASRKNGMGRRASTC